MYNHTSSLEVDGHLWSDAWSGGAYSKASTAGVPTDSRLLNYSVWSPGGRIEFSITSAMASSRHS
jgi:hypothetical protein